MPPFIFAFHYCHCRHTDIIDFIFATLIAITPRHFRRLFSYFISPFSLFRRHYASIFHLLPPLLRGAAPSPH
jgi:hypothetical protein